MQNSTKDDSHIKGTKNGRKYQKTEQRYTVILSTLPRNNAKYTEKVDTINRLIYYKLEFLEFTP